MTIAEMPAADKINRLRQIVAAKKNSNNYFYLVINHIDPDSLAAAFGMRHLLKRLGVERIRILYEGEAGNEQNTFIIYTMDLTARMARLSSAVTNFTDHDVFVLLDSASAKDGRLKDAAGKFVPLVVIDHHRSDDHEEETDNNFIWIEDRGSCASMIVELIEAVGFDFSGKGDDDLPTLLALGIFEDTDNFVNVDELDCYAYAKIIKYCDKERLQLFIKYPISEDFIRALNYALNNRIERGSIVVTSVGMIEAGNVAHIAQIADEQIRRLGYTLAVVWGWVDGDQIYISARSTDSTSPLGEFLHTRFGEKAGAKLAPGGRISVGAAQIPWSAGEMNTPETLPHFLKAIETWVCKRVFG